MSDSDVDMVLSDAEEVVEQETVKQTPKPTKKPKNTKKNNKKKSKKPVKAEVEVEAEEKAEVESEVESEVEAEVESEVETEVKVTKTAPKPKKKSKKKVVKSDSEAEDSDDEFVQASKARNKRVQELNDDTSSETSSTEDEPTISELKEEIRELKKDVSLLKTCLRNIGLAASNTDTETKTEEDGKVNKTKKSKKPKKEKDPSYDLSELTAQQLSSLVIRKENWGLHDVPDDDEEAKKLRIGKPKHPEKIVNEKLRDLVTELVSDQDFLDKHEIEMNDGKITTHSAIKIIKEHCKNNGFTNKKPVVGKNGKTRKVEYYNLTEGDFEDMFEEYTC